jgi:hypothetical protein
MAEGNFGAGWSEIPSYSQEYSNFINSRDLIYVHVVAAFVDVVSFILIAVQYTGHSRTKQVFFMANTCSTVQLLKVIIRLDNTKKSAEPPSALLKGTWCSDLSLLELNTS